jgi:hypothetical protein
VGGGPSRMVIFRDSSIQPSWIQNGITNKNHTIEKNRMHQGPIDEFSKISKATSDNSHSFLSEDKQHSGRQII